jgi:hypothetical protein
LRAAAQADRPNSQQHTGDIACPTAAAHPRRWSAFFHGSNPLPAAGCDRPPPVRGEPRKRRRMRRRLSSFRLCLPLRTVR